MASGHTIQLCSVILQLLGYSAEANRRGGRLQKFGKSSTPGRLFSTPLLAHFLKIVVKSVKY